MKDKKSSHKFGLTMAIDYCCMIGFLDEVFDEEGINRLLGEYSERGITAVQWRVSLFGKLLYRSKLGDMFTAEPFGADDVPGYAVTLRDTFDKAKAIMGKMDPMEVASRLCRKHGIKFYPWLTIYDDAGFHRMTWSNLIREHPEYCWKEFDKDVHFSGTTSYVYPEVVEYRLAQIKELLSYGCDGVYLCTRSHSRPPGWTEEFMKFLLTGKASEWPKTPTGRKLPELFAASQGRFGFDPPAVDAYRQATGRDPHPEDLNWWKFRGGYLIDFLKKAKTLASQFDSELCFGPHHNGGMYPNDFFDWKRMLDEKVVDELHFGATDNYCGNAEVDAEYPWLFDSPGRKSYFHCARTSKSAGEHIAAFESTGNAQFLNRFDGITIFEAYVFEQRPELWHFVDHLRNAANQ